MIGSWWSWSIPVCEDFAMGHIAWGVTSVFVSFVSHRSSAFFRVMRVTAFETQFTAALRPGSLVSCHNFLIFLLYLKRRSRPGISLFKSDKVILFVDSLYADAIEAVKARAALSASTPELISTLGDIRFEARLWNCSQFVNFWSGSENCLVLTWSRMWNIIGKWSESRISDSYIWESDILMHHYIQYISISNWRVMGWTLWRWNFEITSIKQLQETVLEFKWKGWGGSISGLVMCVISEDYLTDCDLGTDSG
jgi:hypothetical protein